MNLSESYKNRIQKLSGIVAENGTGIEPSYDDINDFIYEGEGIFDFQSAKRFSEKILGYNIVKYIGSGSYGASYLTDKRTKLKFTFNVKEFEFAKRHIGGNNEFMADYYNAGKIDRGTYFIEMEYLDPLPSDIKQELEKTLACIISDTSDCHKENMRNRIDHIRTQLGNDGNDIFNWDNYGLKNNQIAIFDPIYENKNTITESYKKRLQELAGLTSNLNANFFKWFDGSKIVNKDGSPMTVHHGTGKKFSSFNIKKSTMSIIWFSSNRKSIETGESGAVGISHIMDLYVSMKNPAGWPEYDKYGLEELVHLGYDGAILPNSDGTFDGFVFEPNQLKSVANKGEWNPGNSNVFK